MESVRSVSASVRAHMSSIDTALLRDTKAELLAIWQTAFSAALAIPQDQRGESVRYGVCYRVSKAPRTTCILRIEGLFG
ncbi:hypothetical protein [Mycobacterium lepromatosis]|nr:hypothetical protein [Mycobacterium lepromatosis]